MRLAAFCWLIVFALGCGPPRPCRKGTLFVELMFPAAIPAVDRLRVTVTIDGTPLATELPYAEGKGNTLELEFPGGNYPEGKSANLVVALLANGEEIARMGREGFVLPAGCGALAIGDVVSGSDMAADLRRGLLDAESEVETDLGIDLGSDTDLHLQLDLGSDMDDGKLPNGQSCASGDQCESGICVDQVCCRVSCSGQCEACDVEGAKGECTQVTSGAPHGSRAACSGAGACHGECGVGARDVCLYPGVEVTCAGASCSGNTRRLAAGCDGQGACTTQQTQTCTMGCAGTECMGACALDADCSAATPAKPFCDNGVCTAQKPNGRACTASAECTSGVCVDGVCCNTACGAQCDSCVEPGSVGTCKRKAGDVVVNANLPARVACAGSGACKGTCNGTAPSCTFPTMSTSCGVAACQSGVVTPVGSCDGVGACAQTPMMCPNGACSGTACGPCPNDATCGTTRWCNNGTCTGKIANGGACGGNNQCTSGQCVDGVCCNTACGSQCDSCVEPGSVGTCKKKSGDVLINPALPARVACTGTGPCKAQCNGVAATCTFPTATTSCGTASCQSGVAKPVGACDGAGVCEQMSVICPNGACSGTMCGPCPNDSTCSATRWCNNGTCSPKLGNGGSCTGSNQCTSGQCVGGRCCAQACGGTTPACSADGNRCECSGASCGGGAVCFGGACCTPSCNDQCSTTDFSDGCGGTCAANCVTQCCPDGSCNRFC